MLLLQVIFTKSTSGMFDLLLPHPCWLHCGLILYCLRTHLLTVFEGEGPAASAPPDFGVTISRHWTTSLTNDLDDIVGDA